MEDARGQARFAPGDGARGGGGEAVLRPRAADVRGGGVEGVPAPVKSGGGAVDAPAVPAGRGVPLPGVRVLPREQPRARR